MINTKLAVTLTVAGAAWALCAPLLAQGSMTTPPGGLTREGADSVTLFGSFAGARFQQVDGMHKGASASITQIAFRLDYRDHDRETAMGRSWTSLTLDVSETTNYEAMSYLFAHNITTTPTRVFASQWSWPSATGLPQSKPDRWGGVGGDLRFPFTKPWSYTGKDEILMDYAFRGGTLANRGQWYIHESVPYHLDHELFRERKHGTPVTLARSLTSPCADSASTVSASRANIQAHAFAYGASSSILTLRNKLQVEHHSYSTAPGAPVVHALGLAGSTTGVEIGARCNPVYVDFNKPVLLIPLHTLNDSLGFSGVMGWAVPWDDGFSDVDIYAQAAWADSRTSAFSLTTAVKLTLPAGLPLPTVQLNKTAYNSDPDVAYALNAPNNYSLLFPFTEYRTR